MDCNLIVFHLILGKRFRIWPILVLDVKDSSNEKKKKSFKPFLVLDHVVSLPNKRYNSPQYIIYWFRV